MTTHDDLTDYESLPTSRRRDPWTDGQTRPDMAATSYQDAASRVPGPRPEPWSPGLSDARLKAARLGFEAFLIALCGYLIGIAGLPPLFDAPGRQPSQSISSVAEGDGAAVETADDGVDDAASQAAPANALPGAGVTVTVGRATWTTGYFQAALFKALLEELGYAVTEPSLNEQGPTDVFRSMADGSVQFWANTWLPNHSAYLEEEMPDGSTVGSHLSHVGNLLPSAGLEGLLVTGSVAGDEGITSLQQINDDPELVQLFDADGNGKADVNGCPSDWSCAKILAEMITHNQWTNLEQISPDDYTAAMDGLIAKVEGGEPVVVYTWSPSGYLTRLRPGDNVLWLDIGGPDKLLDGSITPEFDFDESEPPPLGAACSNDPCFLGWPPADILVTAETSFLEANRLLIRPEAPCQVSPGRPLPSTAWASSSARVTYSSVAMWVATRTTGGAMPWSRASFHRGAHRHHRSPGFRPGKPKAGWGVDRSFPMVALKLRNSAVTRTQTVWMPASSPPVLQQPSR